MCSICSSCRQLRTRDCTDCNILLFNRTRPIVETSRNIGFGCHCSPYQGLMQQLGAVKLSPLHNFWSEVYDFSPKDGNWHIMPEQQATFSHLFPSPPDEVKQLMAGTDTGGQAEAALLNTWGNRPLADGSAHVLVLMPAPCDAATACSFAQQLVGTVVGVKLLHANVAAVSSELAKQMAAATGWDKRTVKQLKAGDCTGFDFAGTPSMCNVIRAEAEAKGALCTDSEEASTLFRCLGLDG